MKKEEKILSWFAHWGEHGHVRLVKVDSDAMAIRVAKRVCCRHLTHVTRNETHGKYIQTVIIYKNKNLFKEELKSEKAHV